MDQTFARVLLLLISSATASKYVFIDDRMWWRDAQIYCRAHHTDLAPVSNAEDMAEIQSFTSYNQAFWIGLERDQTNRSRWKWSGGGEATTFFWDRSQPQNWLYKNYGMILYYKWHDALDLTKKQFLCFSALVVRERKTWEEALEHCRERQRDLASVASETEMKLIRKEVGKDVSTDRLWIGLHFFSGRWLWVDGRRLTYEAWGGGGAPVCPAVNMDCVSLQASEGTGSSDAQQGWEAGDCEEKLHFVCY